MREERDEPEDRRQWGSAAEKLNVKMCIWSEVRAKKRRELRRIEENK